MYLLGKLISFYGLYSKQLVTRGWALVKHDNKTLGSIKKQQIWLPEYQLLC